MSRGASVSETGVKHRTTEEYRRHLSEECTNIELQIGQHRKALSSLQTDIRLAERRVKGLTTMVENLRNEKAEKEAQIVAAERELAAHDGNAQELADRIARLQSELGGIEAKLADKNGKLQEADHSKRIWMPLSSARRNCVPKPTNTPAMCSRKLTRSYGMSCLKIWSASTATCRHRWTRRMMRPATGKKPKR